MRRATRACGGATPAPPTSAARCSHAPLCLPAAASWGAVPRAFGRRTAAVTLGSRASRRAPRWRRTPRSARPAAFGPSRALRVQHGPTDAWARRRARVDALLAPILPGANGRGLAAGRRYSSPLVVGLRPPGAN